VRFGQPHGQAVALRHFRRIRWHSTGSSATFDLVLPVFQ